MSKFKSDIEIARKAKMYPINKVLKKFKVPDKPFAFSPSKVATPILGGLIG